MNASEVQKLPHGLYKIFWKGDMGGGVSLAAVGSKTDGQRWICCTNWTSLPGEGTDEKASLIWEYIERVERVEVEA